MKKVFVILAALLVSLSVFSSSVLAKEGVGKESLVALGDSIPFGYGLEINNEHASRDAYPFLIGEELGVRVRNLGVPGWKTTDLLAALQSDQKYRQAVRHADYITLSIGSNDLLGAFRSGQVKKLIMEYLSTGNPMILKEIQGELGVKSMLERLSAIVLEIRTLSDAPIVVYNVYNPFHSDDPYRFAGNLLLNQINPVIETSLTNPYLGEVVVADAYEVIDNDSDLLSDIHPSRDGHEDLAEEGIEALETLE